MSEVLHIKNFGPIKDVRLELKKFNVLIGENATGKSTIAKVLAVCRYFSYLIQNIALTNTAFEQGLVEWGIDDYTKKDTYIYYSNKHYILEIKEFNLSVTHSKDKKEISQQFISGFSVNLNPVSDEFKQLIKELKDTQPDSVPENTIIHDFRIPPSFYLNNVAKIMDNPFYIPTERGLQSIFSLGKSSISNISDSLYNQFAKIDMINRSFKSETAIWPLNIIYKNENGRGIIKKDAESKFHSLTNGASGYQSAIPIVLIIEYYNIIRKKNKTFIIEELELNLFPSAQQKLVHYLVEKIVKIGNTALLTTHSPYILTSLNNLLYAYNVGQVKSSEVKEHLKIEEKYWLNPDDVSVYKLLTDGTCENIMDEELKQIKVEKIDEISEVLSTQWHQLADINLEK